MSKSRRQFLTHAPLALLGAAVASLRPGSDRSRPSHLRAHLRPSVQRRRSDRRFRRQPLPRRKSWWRWSSAADELAQAAGNWRSAMAPLYERRVGPHKVALEPTLAPGRVGTR